MWNKYPKKYKRFSYQKEKLVLKNFDNLNLKNNICFVKIDVEGLDHIVLRGMKKTIKKYANKVIFSNKYDNYLNKEIINRLLDHLEYIKIKPKFVLCCSLDKKLEKTLKKCKFERKFRKNVT